MKNIYVLMIVILMWIPSAMATIRYVSASGDGTKDGSSWINAAAGNTLQAIINSSVANDEVWVKSGTYYPTATTDRIISFSMKNGVFIYGGFAGTETLLTQRNLRCGPISILSGEIGLAGNTDNSYHVISNGSGLNNTAILDGFVIRDAYDNRAVSNSAGLGGGIYNNGSGAGGVCSPTIRNCVIINNYATFGGGIFNSGYNGGNANPIITNCIIANNTASSGGGGIDNYGLAGNASPTITNCIIYNNTAVLRAGGMYCWGGGNGNSNPIVQNCAFVKNNAVDGGGVVSDRLNESGGGSSGNGNPVFTNCIFWENSASGVGNQFFILGGATFSATYSDIDLTGQTSPHVISGAGTGNINVNPLFANSANAIGIDACWLSDDDGLRLTSTSPAINAGTNINATATDIVGNTRIESGTIDMGPYEYSLLGQTVTFATLAPKKYGDVPFALSGSASSGLTVSYTSSDPAVATVSGNTITISGAGSTTITASQPGNAVYLAAVSVNQILTVNKADQTIVFEPLISKSSSDPAFALTAVSSSGLGVSYSSSNTAVATVSAAIVTLVGQGSTTLTATQAGNTNYNAAASVQQTLTVNAKQSQSITFTALEAKTFGATDFTLSATASSGLAISYLSSNTLVASVSGNIVSIAGAGTVTITANQGGDITYNPAIPVQQTFVVNKAGQIITFAEITEKKLSDITFVLAATTSSGLAVQFSSLQPLVATVSGNIVTFLSKGTATIVAKQPGNSNYRPAEDVSKNLVIVNPQPVISLSGALDFGDVVKGETAQKSFSISNTGDATLQLSGITLPAGFTASLPSTSVASGANITVQVNFAPVEIKTYDGVIAISSNALSGANIINVLGKGIAVTGIGESFSRNTSLSVYPSPSSGIITVHGKLIEDEIAIMDQMGRVVIKKMADKEAGEFYRLDITALPEGFYYIRTVSSEKIEMTRIVKID